MNKTNKARKELYTTKVNELKNIRVEEKIRVVLSKAEIIGDELMGHNYITVDLPKDNDDKNITKFKLSKSSSIESHLDKVNEKFIDAIDEFIMNGSGYKVVSFLGIAI